MPANGRWDLIRRLKFKIKTDMMKLTCVYIRERRLYIKFHSKLAL